MELYEVLTRYRIDPKTKKAFLSGSHVIFQDENGVPGFAQDVNKALDASGKPVSLDAIYGTAAASAILGHAALKDEHAKVLEGKAKELAQTNDLVTSAAKDKKASDNKLATILSERDEARGLVSQISTALSSMLKDNRISANEIAQLQAFATAPAEKRAADAIRGKISALQAELAEKTKAGQ